MINLYNIHITLTKYKLFQMNLQVEKIDKQNNNINDVGKTSDKNFQTQSNQQDQQENRVKLISYTKNADDNKNLEELIVYCARVSNPTNQYFNMNNEKLIKYLISNAHWSPFEMISICLEINTTRIYQDKC